MRGDDRLAKAQSGEADSKKTKAKKTNKTKNKTPKCRVVLWGRNCKITNEDFLTKTSLQQIFVSFPSFLQALILLGAASNGESATFREGSSSF